MSDNKKTAIDCVRVRLASAEDDLYRAKSSFKFKTDKEIDQQYGKSGDTCREVVRKYIQKVESLKECQKWLEALL